MNTVPSADRDILRELARQVRRAAEDPVNAERQAARRRIANLEGGPPAIFIFQEPWSELNTAGELDLHCQDDFCRGLEQELRRNLYRWRHYPGDLVLEASSPQLPCIHDSGFGLHVQEDVLASDPANDVVSHHFHVQLREEADAAKIQMPVVTYDAARTAECHRRRREIFDGLLDTPRRGCGQFWFAP